MMQVTWDTLSAKFLAKKQVDLHQLSAIQRIILTTDGTLTDILEAYLLETITVIKLSESPLYITGDNPLDVDNKTPVLDRKIFLQGQESKKNWLYAESIIVTERVHQRFNQGLQDSNKPIGRLWNENKVETFKETLCRFEEPAGELGKHFSVDKDDMLMCRTYRVFSQQQPVMLITEKFPESFYLSV